MHAIDSQAHATEVLLAEHQVILNVLDCLERLADDAAATRTVDLLSAADALEFLRVFADRCHHGKEENALFPLLIRNGLPRHVGPLAVMLAEHDLGRAAVRAMRTAVEAGGAGAQAERFVAAARGYVTLLRDHIAKENGVLFPMAEGMLDEGDRVELAKAFETLENDDLGGDAHERCLGLARDLMQRLDITPASPPAFGGGCCGHGPSGCH